MPEHVAIVGAGVVGCATAWFLAREGLQVSVFDAGGIGAGASGRNAGLVEHPYDAAQEGLHDETVALLDDLLGAVLADEPVGVLLVVEDEDAARSVARHHAGFSSLRPDVLSPQELRSIEPGLGDAIWACRLWTGYPVEPALAAERFARRAAEHGATFHLGHPAEVTRDGDAVRGVRVRGERHDADAVVVCAGAWSAEVVDPAGGWRPIRPSWGVSASVHADAFPRHALVDGRIAEIQTGAAPADSTAFSLIVTPAGAALGSTFLAAEPDPRRWVPQLLDDGRRFWPALSGATVTDVLACPRPRSLDGRPLLGRVPGVEHLWIAAGHGGRGISTGAGSARLVAEAIRTGSDAVVPAALRADRFGAP